MASPITPYRSPSSPSYRSPSSSSNHRSPPSTTYRSPSSTPTGSWRHPAMEEVTRRNSARAFTDVTFHRLSLNGIAFFSTFLAEAIASHIDVASYLPPSPLIKTYGAYFLWFLRLLFIFNIFESLMRLLRPADEFTDLPLTPTQRKLLGLNPDSPLSENARLASAITPPRYPKSTPTSRSGSPSFGASTSSPTMQRKAASTPPPMTPSPLRMGGGFGDRMSSSTGSGFGSLGAGSPIRVGGKSSLTLGNKWVYEKNIQRKGDGRWTALERNIFSPRPSERTL
ncbi:hypothetical protein RUND412_002110 [Rhizina undulata]